MQTITTTTARTPARAHAVEVERLQRHFLAVLHELDAAPTEALDPATRARREHLIEALGAYAARGVFPQNRDFPTRTEPYFVDAIGTRCAVGHLMDVSGAGALVRSIAATRNHATVAELGADPAVIAWLARHGLSAAEAARIQPTYCAITIVQCVCAASPASTVAEVTIEAGSGGAARQARVDAVQGAATVAVDDVIAAADDLRVGDHYLVRWVGESGPMFHRRVGDAIELGCQGESLRIDADAATAAWLAASCDETYAAQASDALSSFCDTQDEAEGGGCAGGAATLPVGALITAWLARRRFRA